MFKKINFILFEFNFFSFSFWRNSFLFRRWLLLPKLNWVTGLMILFLSLGKCRSVFCCLVPYRCLIFKFAWKVSVPERTHNDDNKNRWHKQTLKRWNLHHHLRQSPRSKFRSMFLEMMMKEGKSFVLYKASPIYSISSSRCWFTSQFLRCLLQRNYLSIFSKTPRPVCALISNYIKI